MARMEALRVRFPLLVPFRAAHGTTVERDVILVAAHGDGAVGWGECPTLTTAGYVGETTDDAWRWFVSGGPAPLMARGAVLDARRDLRLRLAGTPAVPATAPPALPLRAVVGRPPDLDALLAAVEREVVAGVTHVKLKIEPGWDVGPVAAVRGAWPTLDVAVDANGAYGVDDLAPFLALGDAGVTYIEQPAPPGSWPALAARWPAAAPPVALDESIRGSADLDRAGVLGGVRYLNLKPARVGGVEQAQVVAAAAVERGLEVFVGGMLESGVGRATALGLAAVVAADRPTDLGPSERYVVDDITPAIRWAGLGRVEVPRGPGIGVAPRPDRLAATVVDRVEVDRVEVER